MPFQIPEHRLCIEARAGFREDSRHVPVTSYDSAGKEYQQFHQQKSHLFGLFGGSRVGGVSLFVESAFVADADGTAVEGAAVGSRFEQSPVLGDGTVAADIEMIAHCTEPSGLMVSQELFHGIVVVASSGGAVENEEADGIRSVHHPSVFHLGEELALVEHLVLCDGYGKCFLNHIRIKK